MDTIEQSHTDATSDQSIVDPLQDPSLFTKPEISGFDAGARPILKEPSFYLSIAIVFVVALASLNKTPILFWLSFLSISLLAFIFHILAERAIFNAKPNFDKFTAPFEGIFVVTFGVLLPGLGLLAYGVHSLWYSFYSNPVEESSKVVLLLLVPICNFTVWSAVRKGYLIRPRLVGLMNGLALGLSASWTTIWLNCLFFHSYPSSKFGWMLLLCASPFLLIAAIRLRLDLLRKTEVNMRLITTSFSVLGGLLSGLLIFTPMIRAFSIKFLIDDAKQETPIRSTSIAMLRSTATPADLRPSQHPISGFTLPQMLIQNRGLESGSEADKDLYFRITGKPYSTIEDKDDSLLFGPVIPGLSLAKSQISGRIDTASFSASLDWTYTLHNIAAFNQEAYAEIALPKGATVSRVTLWINGQPQEGAFASTSKTTAAYQSVVNRQRDPLLVTMSAPDRILVRCFPVPLGGGDMKFRIGFKLPLEVTNDQNCRIQLPKIIGANFSQPKRHRISLFSNDMLAHDMPGMSTAKSADGYILEGILKPSKSKELNSLLIRRTAPFIEFATPDWYSHNKRFIVEQLCQISESAPKRLFVVIDSSASLASKAGEINSALSLLPPNYSILVYFVPEQLDSNDLVSNCSKTLKQAKSMIIPSAFIGGQNNESLVREALETAAEERGNAVLWIHGPQPIARNAQESRPLDLVHSVRLYDLQVEDGPASLVQALQTEDASALLTYVSVPHKALLADMKQLLSSWENREKKLSIRRVLSKTPPNIPIIWDKDISAQVTSLWAREQVSRFLAAGDKQQAEEFASNYRLVTPVTGAVVLENATDYAENQLNPGAYKNNLARTNSDTNQVFNSNGTRNLNSKLAGGDHVGAPVDPRFGQSNEVGQLSDYGYDNTRDIARMVTFISFIISLLVASAFLRSRKELTTSAFGKAIALALAVPIVVHLMGTFMINNFGGLGGGL